MLVILHWQQGQPKVFQMFNDLDQDDLEVFLDTLADRIFEADLGWWDRSFSSNDYDAWPTPGRGWTPHGSRIPWTDIHGAEILQAVLKLMETSGLRGRRFRIKGGDILLSEDDSVIGQFMFIDT